MSSPSIGIVHKNRMNFHQVELIGMFIEFINRLWRRIFARWCCKDTSWGDKGVSDVISAGLSEKPEKSQTPEVLENDKLLLNSLGKVKFK